MEVVRGLLLNTKRKTKWESKPIEEIRSFFTSVSKLKEFTDAELKEILSFLNVKLGKRDLQVPLNLPKYEKLTDCPNCLVIVHA